jgi:hypothetical protein
MPGIIGLLISLIVLAIVLAVLWWIITMIPVPPPLVWIIRVMFALICLIALLSLLFGGWTFPFAGHGYIGR